MKAQSSHSSPDRDWQPFASLELPCTAGAWAKLEGWLAQALRPLALPAELSAKLLASAKASAASISEETHQLRLLIYTSSTRPAPGQSWGFFRILKTEPPAQDGRRTRAIIFYLYGEGRAA
jgi:hypothetical protein